MKKQSALNWLVPLIASSSLYRLSIIWYLVLFPKGVGAAQRINRGPAIFVGALAFPVYVVLFLTFNR